MKPRAMSESWRWWGAVAVIALAAVAAWVYQRASIEAPVFVVDRGPVIESIEERGRTRLPDEVEITMPRSGRVAPIRLRVGDRVAKGDVVARLVEKDLELALAKAEAAVKELEAAVAEAEDERLEQDLKRQAGLSVESMAKVVEAARVRSRESRESLKFVARVLERTRKLTAEDVRSEDELDRTEVEFIRQRSQAEQDEFTEDALELLQQAIALLPRVVDDYLGRRRLGAAKTKQQLAAARASLEETRLLLSRAIMKSPTDGVVLYRATTSERPLAEGTVLLRIGDLARLEVHVDVLTEASLKIPPRAPVELFFGNEWDSRASALRGVVDRIEPEGFTKVSALGIEQQRVWVVIRLDESSREWLRKNNVGVGYRVRTRIVTNRKPRALRVPRSALGRSDRGQWQAMVVKRGRLEVRTVQIGLQNDRWAEVTRGLSEGDVVVVAPQPKWSAGQRVRQRRLTADVLDPRTRAPRTTPKRP